MFSIDCSISLSYQISVLFSPLCGKLSLNLIAPTSLQGSVSNFATFRSLFSCEPHLTFLAFPSSSKTLSSSPLFQFYCSTPFRNPIFCSSPFSFLIFFSVHSPHFFHKTLTFFTRQYHFSRFLAFLYHYSTLFTHIRIF